MTVESTVPEPTWAEFVAWACDGHQHQCNGDNSRRAQLKAPEWDPIQRCYREITVAGWLTGGYVDPTHYSTNSVRASRPKHPRRRTLYLSALQLDRLRKVVAAGHPNGLPYVPIGVNERGGPLLFGWIDIETVTSTQSLRDQIIEWSVQDEADRAIEEIESMRRDLKRLHEDNKAYLAQRPSPIITTECVSAKRHWWSR